MRHDNSTRSGTRYEWRFRVGIVIFLILAAGVSVAPLPIVAAFVGWGVLGGAAVLISALLTWWRPRVRSDVPIFLMLHSVSEEVVDPSCANNTLRPSELERLICDLIASGYTFQTAGDAIGTPVPRSVVLTFDDGLADNYEVLFPILLRHHVPATCFVTNRGESDPAFLTPEQIREMAASGLVEFGGHTATHTVLDRVSPEVAAREVAENACWLEHILGAPPVLFAYPCGGYNDAVIGAVKAAGYRYAFTMHKKMRPVRTDPMRIHRQIIPRGKTPLQAYLLATRGRYRL